MLSTPSHLHTGVRIPLLPPYASPSYRMKLRDDDAASFVAQFNAYRKEAKAKNQALEGELLRVFSHAKALEAVVRRVEKGEYAVRQRGASSRVVVPCIPLQDRPVRGNYRILLNV